MYDVLSPILLHHISKNTGSACPLPICHHQRSGSHEFGLSETDERNTISYCKLFSDYLVVLEFLYGAYISMRSDNSP